VTSPSSGTVLYHPCLLVYDTYSCLHCSWQT
jgi:hypothetical protein